MESMEISETFWKNKKIFISGHTGFKGCWLSHWLNFLGSEITGYSIDIPTEPSLFSLSKIKNHISNIEGDIRNFDSIEKEILRAKPDIIFHMAAQSLVTRSYENPIETYSTNVMGTLNILESVKKLNKNISVIIVTSDKCYKNKEWIWGYRENDELEGYDPYSNSKACAELVTNAYRNSFFNPKNYQKHGVAIATVRAGNVLGGGDWAKDRLFPDIYTSLIKNKQLTIRSPHSKRPWQHVLSPLHGYLSLAEKLYNNEIYSGAWNFGPDESSVIDVLSLLDIVNKYWKIKLKIKKDSDTYHEAMSLKIDSSKAKYHLNWKPYWEIEETIEKTIDWYNSCTKKMNMEQITLNQIEAYMKSSLINN
jgi:CDP-glucose 4,6-dehydratase